MSMFEFQNDGYSDEDFTKALNEVDAAMSNYTGEPYSEEALFVIGKMEGVVGAIAKYGPSMDECDIVIDCIDRRMKKMDKEDKMYHIDSMMKALFVKFKELTTVMENETKGFIDGTN